jgi:hypothetical protein
MRGRGGEPTRRRRTALEQRVRRKASYRFVYCLSITDSVQNAIWKIGRSSVSRQQRGKS